jgi:hypothetical protein
MNKNDFIKQFGIKGYEWWVKQVTELTQKERIEHSRKIFMMEKLHHEELKLYVRKSLDYGSEPVNETGIVGLLVRILDKGHRALHLSEDGKIAMLTDEKLEDTLMDISNYANMALIEMKKTPYHSQPLSEVKQKNGRNDNRNL